MLSSMLQERISNLKTIWIDVLLCISYRDHAACPARTSVSSKSGVAPSRCQSKFSKILELEYINFLTTAFTLFTPGNVLPIKYEGGNYV